MGTNKKAVAGEGSQNTPSCHSRQVVLYVSRLRFTELLKLLHTLFYNTEKNINARSNNLSFHGFIT